MPDLDSSAAWALVVILLVPVLIIVAAEVDERLRQRESTMRPAVEVIRSWGLPFFALWAVLVPVLAVDNEGFLVRVATSGFILAVATAVLRISRALISAYQDRPRTAEQGSVPQLLLALPRLVTILVVGWLLIDGVWGVDLSAALTALGVTSLVVSFALQDTLSGLASGMLLLSDQPFTPGDWITTNEQEGEVVDVSWRTSRIRTRDGDIIIVPNSQLAGAAVINYSSPDPLHRVTVSLQVAYVNPPTLAIGMLLDAAKGVDGVLDDPAPYVFVTQIDDPLMGYDVHMWVNDYAVVPRVKSDFGRLVWYQSHRHGVPLPSPAQDLYLYDGVASGLVGIPTTADLRDRLQAAPLLASLDDGELDALASRSRQDRFAVGERVRGPESTSRELMIIVDGTLDLVVPLAAELQVVGQFHAGETIGVLDLGASESHGAFFRAASDCEAISIDVEAIGIVASRNEELSAAMNRLAAIRRRRLERLIEQHSLEAAVTQEEVSPEVARTLRTGLGIPDTDGRPDIDDTATPPPRPGDAPSEERES